VTCVPIRNIADTYSQVIPGDADNLIANYRFDATTGAVVDSASGVSGADNGTLVGDATRVETAPDVYGTTLSIQENQSASGQFEASASAFSVATAATNGTVAIDATTGIWTYVPTANFSGTDTFTLLADGVGSETITVTVNDTPQNSVNVAGGAAQFDGGLLDRIQTSIPSGTIADKVTFEMNVAFNDLTGHQNFLGYKGETNNQVFNVYQTSANTLSFHVPFPTIDSCVTVAADTW